MKYLQNMEDKHFKAFTVITAFVDDLHSVFANKKSPLDLYYRLTEHIKARDVKAISRIVAPFERFVQNHKDAIESGDLSKIPKGTIIPYDGSERVYIEIEKFIYRGDKDVKSNIHRHLLAISAVLTTDEGILREFEEKMKIPSLGSSDTPEAQMINQVVGKLENALGESEGDINPMTAVSQLLSGGIVNELFSSMQQGISSGEMDINNLMGTLQSTLGALAQASDKGTSKDPSLERPKLTIEEPPQNEPELD